MSDSSKAVFLSYASQDAAAALRICEALRAAGVEVWFDQSELVGGDAWDAKIRKHIKECTLLIPVISAATQARTEGYFRLEWRLADQRTHLMAKGRPFLLPVVIDDTHDAEAHVPDSFTEVQWTRLPGGETPSAFTARVKKLLSGEEGARTSRPGMAEPTGREARSPATKSKPIWLWGLLALVVAGPAYCIFKPRRSPEEIARLIAQAQALGINATNAAKPAAPPAAAVPAATESQRLIQQARELITKSDRGTAKWEAASLLCERALALDPTDAEALAVASQVDSRLWFHLYDRTPKRNESARSRAARAIDLAPEAFESRLAQATFLVLVAGRGQSDEAEGILRRLQQQFPPEPRVLNVLGTQLMNLERYPEGMAVFDEAARLPGNGVNAYTQQAWWWHRLRRVTEMDAALDRAFAIHPAAGGMSLRVFYDLGWYGDPDRALANLKRLSGEELAEDTGISAAIRVYRWRRDPEAVLRFLETVPRDWLWWSIRGPKAAITGDAHAAAHRPIAARADWQSALGLVDRKLADSPNDLDLLEWKAYLHARLGEAEAAREAYQRCLEAPQGERGLLEIEKLAYIAPANEVLAELEQRVTATVADLEAKRRVTGGFISAADLRLNPAWDPVRSLPRFQALLARLESDPRFKPPAPGGSVANAAMVAPADEKSVAVLAFANLSDDKGNEYFSDGISEELLTALQKIPGLHVAARTSSFYFKGKEATAQEIGAKLGVANLVEGSVQKSGSRVKVSVHLSRAATGEEVWSESYTRELKDVFALQEELTLAIVGELRGQLAGGDHAAVKAAVKGGTSNAEAFQQYLQGRYYANRHAEKPTTEAIGYFQRAVDLDPAFALAWAGLAETHVWLCEFSDVLDRKGFELHVGLARTAVDRALALEPQLPEGLLARSLIQSNIDFDWKGAEATLQTAHALAPADPAIVTASGNLAGALGDTALSVARLRQAVALDPVNPVARSYLAFAYVTTGQFDEAQAEYSRLADLNPTAPWAYAGLGLAYVLQGKFEPAVTTAQNDAAEWARLLIVALARFGQKRLPEADAALAQLTTKFADTAAYQIAEVQAYRGDRDRAVEWLERARQQRDGGILGITTDPLLVNLHSDPRYAAFLRKVGLADEQLK